MSRRMSFIGSPERTRGIASKLLTAGGEVVNHSSVFAFHGSGPAIAPVLRLREMLTIVTSTPEARMKAPIVEIRLKSREVAHVFVLVHPPGHPFEAELVLDQEGQRGLPRTSARS